MESNYWTWYASRIHDSISNRATKHISFSANESADQCIGCTADSASRYRTSFTTSGYTYVSTFASEPKQHVGPWPTPQQQNLAMILQPKSPTEVLANRIPHANGVTWVFHDLATGFVRHVNVPPVAQQHPSQRIAQSSHGNEMVLYQSPSNQSPQQVT